MGAGKSTTTSTESRGIAPGDHAKGFDFAMERWSQGHSKQHLALMARQFAAKGKTDFAVGIMHAILRIMAREADEREKQPVPASTGDGPTVITPDESGALLVALPDGSVKGAAGSIEAVKIADSWHAKHPGAVKDVQWLCGAVPPGMEGIQRLPGGVGDRSRASDFSEAAVAKGMLTELEHTPDPVLAQEIALSHLTESAQYYDFLDDAEKQMDAAKKGQKVTMELSDAQRAAIAKHGAKRNPARMKPGAKAKLAAIKAAKAPSKAASSVAKAHAVSGLMTSAERAGHPMTRAQAQKAVTFMFDAMTIMGHAGLTHQQATEAICGGSVPNPVTLNDMQKRILETGRAKIAEMRASGMTDKEIGEFFDAMHAGLAPVVAQLGTIMTTPKAKGKSPKKSAKRGAKANPTETPKHKWPRKGQKVKLTPEMEARRQAFIAKMKAAKSNPVTEPDQIAADELVLYADNEFSLHAQRQSIEKNLIGKMRKGQYRDDLAAKAWLHWMDEAAKKYVREFGSKGARVDSIFNKATRELAAADYAKRAKSVLEEEHGLKVTTYPADVNERIRAIVEDPDFIRGVPEGQWGNVKTILTSLVVNDVGMVTSFFVDSMKNGKIHQFYVDDRVKLPAAQSNYSMGKVTRAQVIKAVKQLQAASKPAAAPKGRAKKNPTEGAPKSPRPTQSLREKGSPPPFVAVHKVVPPAFVQVGETPKAAKPAKAKAGKGHDAVQVAGPQVKGGRGRPAKVASAKIKRHEGGEGFLVTLSDQRVFHLPKASMEQTVKFAQSRAKVVGTRGKENREFVEAAVKMDTKRRKAKTAKAKTAPHPQSVRKVGGHTYKTGDFVEYWDAKNRTHYPAKILSLLHGKDIVQGDDVEIEFLGASPGNVVSIVTESKLLRPTKAILKKAKPAKAPKSAKKTKTPKPTKAKPTEAPKPPKGRKYLRKPRESDKWLYRVRSASTTHIPGVSVGIVAGGKTFIFMNKDYDNDGTVKSARYEDISKFGPGAFHLLSLTVPAAELGNVGFTKKSAAELLALANRFASGRSDAKSTTKVKPAKVKPAKVKPAKVKPAKVKPAKVKPAKKAPHKAGAKPQGLRISDPQAFAVLASLEGAGWAAYQEEDKLGAATFWANKMAFDVLVEGNLLKVSDIADVLEGGGVIAGSRGSYFIERRGRIRLLPGSSSEHEAAAKRLGITRL